MRLTEAEGKTLLKDTGMDVPDFCLLSKDNTIPDDLIYPVILKAQTLTGARGKAGLIKVAADKDEVEQGLQSIWKARYQKRPFENILIEDKFYARKEYYISFYFDQASRSAVLSLSKFGGMDIEVVAKRQPGAVIVLPIDTIEGIDKVNITELLEKIGVKPELHEKFNGVITNLYKVFTNNDCELVEINPLIETEDNRLVAADCKMVIDDTALYRHEFNIPARTGFRALTEMEQKAREIDARTHRGVVGRTFLELEGDIAFISSGGGASITCLDALISYGGRPSCFAEYSGNPEKQDVYDLTKLILSRPYLHGLWVVGPTANFTDVFETLSGVVGAIKEVKPGYPIVIRRAGPHDQEAKTLIEQVAKDENLDLVFIGEEISMTESAKVLMDKLIAQGYAV